MSSVIGDSSNQVCVAVHSLAKRKEAPRLTSARVHA
jgi:hypothetical protein